MVAGGAGAGKVTVTDRWWLLVLIAGALLVRIPLVGTGLWRDEGYTYFDIVSDEIRTVFDRLISSEGHPPLFFLFMYVWAHRFGFSEWALKLPSLVAMVAVVPLTYLLGCIAGTRRTAVIATLLVISSYELVYYSLEARPYAFATLFATGAALLFCRYIRFGKASAFAGSVFLMALLVYTHYIGFVLVCAVAASYAYLQRVCGLSLRLGVAGFGFIALVSLPLSGLMRIQMHSGTPWAYVPSLLERPTFIQYTAALILPMPSGPAFTYGWLVSCVFVAALGLRMWRAQRTLHTNPESVARQTAAVDLAFGFILTVAIVGLAMIALFEPRYFVLFLPVSCVYCAHWIEGLSVRHPTYRSFSIVLAIAIVNLTAAYREFTIPKSGIRALVQQVQRSGSRQAVYVVAPDFSGSTVGYYRGAALQPIHGFATWEHPEVFRLSQYAQRWSDPRAIDDACRKIGELAGSGILELDLVRVGERGERLHDSGSLRYSRADELITALRKRYRTRFTADYAGSAESASLIVLDLRNPKGPVR